VPYRINARPEADPPEPEEPWIAVLRSQERRTRIGAVAGFLLAGALFAAAWVGPGPSESSFPSTIAQRTAEARAGVARARALATNEQVRFESGMHAAIDAKLEARPDLGACPISFPHELGSLHTPSFPLLVVDAHDEKLPSQAIAGVLADVARAERQIDAGRYEEASLYARALESKNRLKPEVVVVASARTEPAATGDATFRPGAIAGRAYLYDFASHTVICAADVEAKSSNSIGYSFIARADAPPSSGATASLTASLERDLTHQLSTAVSDNLVWRAGPPL
jgi:hypothetical protein